MSNNPYAPPSAPVADIDRSGLNDQTNRFFAVGTVKMFVMTLVTFGIYEVYWFYKHWVIVRDRDRSDIWPVPRAIFAIFYVYQLFKRMRADGEELGVKASLAAGPLATVFIICNFVWRAPEPYSLIGFITAAVLVMAQSYANEVNLLAAPDDERNTRFTGWNWFGIAVGGLFWVLVIIGLMMPGEA